MRASERALLQVGRRQGFGGRAALRFRPINRGCDAAKAGGAERNRTAGLLIANEALSQLSYSPEPRIAPGYPGAAGM